MALFCNISKGYTKFCPAVLLLLKITRQQFCHGKSTTLEIDVIDDFTSQLLQRKVGKWVVKKNATKLLLNSIHRNDKHYNKIKIDDLSIEEVTVKFQSAIDNGCNKEVLDLLHQCVECRICPPLNVLMNALSVCSQSGNKHILEQIRELLAEIEPQLLENNSHFNHFIAEAIWVRGDVCKAIEIFEEVYRNNAYLRRRIRLMLKYLIIDLVANRSEAALLNIISFSERLSKDFKDYYPLTCIWQACFLSDWYSDQQIALQLLENNNGLCKSIVNRISYVVFISLKGHNTEVIYRLLELFLKYDMKSTLSNILMSLLNYYFHWGNRRGCMECIHWAINNNIDLPKNLHLNLIKLLACNTEDSSARDLHELVTSKSNKHNYEFKF